MKKDAEFDAKAQELLRLFAQPNEAQIAASRDRVFECLASGRPAPLADIPIEIFEASQGQGRGVIGRFVMVTAVLAVVGIVGLVSLFSVSSPATNRIATPPAGDLKVPPSTPPLQQAATVPIPTSAAPSAFEVASIRQHSPPLTFLRFQVSGDRFTSEGTSLAALVRYAYDVAAFQVNGGPDWALDRNVQFHVQAKASQPASTAEMRAMLRSLLADRFQLKLRRQVRQTDGYILRVDGSGDKRGGRLKPSSGVGPVGCFPFPARCTRTTMAGLAEYLSTVVFRTPVVDQTSLTGIFDLELEWTPDSSQFGGNGGVGFFAGSPSGPSIFTAIREQLGLVLQPMTAPMEILTIESAEQPGEN